MCSHNYSYALLVSGDIFIITVVHNFALCVMWDFRMFFL